LLFAVVALAAALDRLRFGGFSLGTTASAILVGAGLSITSAGFGINLQPDEFAKRFAYYLFMYAVGLRIDPAFVNSFDREGIGFARIAVIASVTGLLAVIAVSRMLNLAAGMDVGLLADALTESAAIGAAEGAVASGAALVPEGMTAQQLSANAPVGYGLTQVFGSVGIILMVRLLQRIFGIDAPPAPRAYEEEQKMKCDGTLRFHPNGPTSVRAAEVLEPRDAWPPAPRLSRALQGLSGDCTFPQRRADQHKRELAHPERRRAGHHRARPTPDRLCRGARTGNCRSRLHQAGDRSRRSPRLSLRGGRQDHP
jgi:hypothetical protein